MWRKHCSVFQDHIKYIHNDIVNTYRLGIFHYNEHVHEMYDLNNFLPPPWKKGDEYDQADWKIRDN